jgi:hypothetical protein
VFVNTAACEISLPAVHLLLLSLSRRTRRRVLGEPPALRASSGRRWRRAVAGQGEKVALYFLSSLLVGQTR